MIDLHQGTTGEELRELRPGLGSVALAQLDVVGALLKGQLALAARTVAGAYPPIRIGGRGRWCGFGRKSARGTV